MRLLPNLGSKRAKVLRRPSIDKRQNLLGADSTATDKKADIAVLPPPTRTDTRIVTVINGYTAVGPVEPNSPVLTTTPTETDPEETRATETTTSATRMRRPTIGEPIEDETDTDASSTMTSTRQRILDSPATETILASSSPTLEDDTRTSETFSRTKNKPDKTNSATKSKTPSAASESGKSASHHDEKKGSATTWIAIAAGVIGSLLLMMAISAYYRRWRRKHREKQKVTSDDESFVTTKQVEPLESPTGGDWSNSLKHPMLPVYQNRSGRGSLLPEPGSEPRQEDVAPWRRTSYVGNVSSMPPGAVPRRDVRNEPMVIETSGDSRQFSRPVSEVILNGQNEQSGDQHYGYGPSYAPPNVRHDSHMSSRYEAIDDSRGAVMDYRYQ